MTGYIVALRKHIGTEPIIVAGASVILVNSEGQILLQLRTDNHCWGIPSGSMELGESFEETARREVLEETGLHVGSLDLFMLNSGRHTCYRYPNGDEVYLACAVFTSCDFSGEIQIDGDETAELRWFHPSGLPENLSPNDQLPIAKYLERIQRT